jgi:20S proteasome subunit alpha 3
MDSTTLSAEKLELAEVSLTAQGEVKYKVFSADDLNKMLLTLGITQPTEES